jgi:hypothetical protein
MVDMPKVKKLTADIEAVLVAHQHTRQIYPGRCTCDPIKPRNPEQWRRHLAIQLRKVVT